MAEEESFPTDGVEISEGISNLAESTMGDFAETEEESVEVSSKETVEVPAKETVEETLPPEDLNVVEEEVVEEVVEEVEEEIPDNMPEDAKAALIKMRQSLKEMKDKLAESGSTTDDEHAKLIAERDVLRNQLGSNGLQETAEFKDTYLKPLHAEAAKLVRTGEDYGIDKETLQKAMTMNKADRIRLIRESATSNDDVAITELLPMFTSMLEKQAVIQNALKNADETADKLKTQSSDKVVSLTGEMLNDTVTRLRDAEGHFLLTDSKSDPEWKNKIVAAAKRVISGDVTDQELVNNALKAQLTDSYKAMYLRLHGEHRALLGKNKKVSKLKAKVGGGSKTVSKKPSTNKAMSLSDLADSAVYGD